MVIKQRYIKSAKKYNTKKHILKKTKIITTKSILQKKKN